MLLLSTQILIAEKPLRDDAFKILMDWLPGDKIRILRFDELNRMHTALMEFNGMIQANESYIEYLFLWQDEEHYLNASNYYDTICKKYSIYPKYLKLYND